VSGPEHEFVEIFLQEASEHLQFLREYSGILQDPYPVPEDLERLYISAHTLAGTSGSYGYPLFAEVSGKLAHIFQYAMNATIGAEAAGPLVEFISEAIAVLESDLLMVSANGVEAGEDIAAFKQKYPFAFQAPEAVREEAAYVDEVATAMEAAPEEAAPVAITDLPQDGEVPDEILEFFVPEAEEHLQVVTECLLALEANPNPEDINKLFRAMHTIKGAAAQVGLLRISRVAHRAELDALINAAFARNSAEDVLARLDAAQIANARVNTMADVWEHPQLRARHRWVEVATPAGTVPALLPPGVPDAQHTRMDPVPALGQHTNALLAELGYREADIVRLASEKAI